MDDTPPPEPPAQRRNRLIVGLSAAAAMAASAVFAPTLLGYADGSHGPLLAVSSLGRTVVLLLAALVGALLVLRPHKPDPRIARAGVLAVGVVGLVAGLDSFLGATDAHLTQGATASWPGPGSWLLLLSGVLFILLRWWGSVWPQSRFEAMLHQARARRG